MHNAYQALSETCEAITYDFALNMPLKTIEKQNLKTPLLYWLDALISITWASKHEIHIN